MASKHGLSLFETPTLDELQSFLESKGVYISLAPELYTDGINWNWSLGWYLPKDQWEMGDAEQSTYEEFSEAPAKQIPYRISEGTGWYGDNGEFPTRHDAMVAALTLGFRKLDPLYRNNSCEKLAKLYGKTMNELLTEIRVFASELGDWSFRELSEEQIAIIVKHLGNPLEK